MKKYSISIVAFVFLTLISCSKKETETSKEATPPTPGIVKLSAAQVQNAGIKVGQPSEKELSGVLSLQGTVTVPPRSRVDVTFPLGGYIRKTNVMPGMHVKKGQVLAQIEDMQYIQLQQDYLTAKEKYNLTVMEYNRQKELNAKKASSDKLFEQITSERETQRITMTSLGQKLSLLGIDTGRLSTATISKSIAIVSPVNGLVSKVNINIGKYVGPTEMLFELIDMQDVVLSFTAFEKDIAYLQTGQKLDVYTNDQPDRKHRATIAYINHSLNEDRAAEVICKVESYEPALLPGLFVNGTIEVQYKKALTVPEASVVDWKGKKYVFEAQPENHFAMIPVAAGIAQDGLQQIVSDKINSGSKLVIQNAYTLLMKTMNSGEE
ncbi:efflux RND transporter periplasmic adaptor subunit [Flavobacterium supellecticarium]|uniref:Efflux RND transporter periplasmic adaptor subunit n=1 Tax=Flavobacterium supellecticarium TaxID=2565924 RepID=A0A4S4A4D0_9FLAO|nr:efflux RND transporter periplasmic adaptor subunit [Flavobacterium supellecticarium]THF53330.1 efflux RND transporter periplasmic adaptor subunit [Flavobacterium supellecticarium]